MLNIYITKKSNLIFFFLLLGSCSLSLKCIVILHDIFGVKCMQNFYNVTNDSLDVLIFFYY